MTKKVYPIDLYTMDFKLYKSFDSEGSNVNSISTGISRQERQQSLPSITGASKMWESE